MGLLFSAVMEKDGELSQYDGPEFADAPTPVRKQNVNRMDNNLILWLRRINLFSSFLS